MTARSHLLRSRSVRTTVQEPDVPLPQRQAPCSQPAVFQST